MAAIPANPQTSFPNFTFYRCTHPTFVREALGSQRVWPFHRSHLHGLSCTRKLLRSVTQVNGNEVARTHLTQSSIQKACDKQAGGLGIQVCNTGPCLTNVELISSWNFQFLRFRHRKVHRQRGWVLVLQSLPTRRQILVYRHAYKQLRRLRRYGLLLCTNLNNGNMDSNPREHCGATFHNVVKLQHNKCMSYALI